MSVSVRMPQLGESVTEGTVTRWLKKEGDLIKADEPLLEVSTDKVDTEIPSPASGVLRGITVAEEETVEVGAELAVIEEEGAQSPASQPSAGQPSAAQPAAAQPAAQPSANQPAAAPAARQYPRPAAVPPLADAPPGGPPPQQATAAQAQPQQAQPQQAQPRQTQPQEAQRADTSVAETPPVPWPAQAPSGGESRAAAPANAAADGEAAPPGPTAAQTPSATLQARPAAQQFAPLTPLPGEGEGPYITPLVRKLAAEHGVDLASVQGTGVGGRIRKHDVLEASRANRAPLTAEPQATARATDAPSTVTPWTGPPSTGAPATGAPSSRVSLYGAAPPTPAPPTPAPPTPAPSAAGSPAAVSTAPAGPAAASPADTAGATGTTGTTAAASVAKQHTSQVTASPVSASSRRPAIEPSPLRGTTERMSRLRQLIAQRMVDSLHTSAQLTTVVEADVTKIARLRQRAKADFERREGVRLSFLPFFALATLEALKMHPKLNALIDTDKGEVTYYDVEHLGIAVDTDRGLLVPVIRNAGDLNIGGLARKIDDLAKRTRSGQVSPDELSGGTFTLTNTGSRGAIFDTPIINQPQVAILGTGAVAKRPVVLDDPDLGEVIAVRSMVYLALTYDHRLVDGADAARFLATVMTRLEEGTFEAELGL